MDQFGHWKLENGQLYHDTETYKINLSNIVSSAEILFVVFDVMQQNWCSDNDIAQLTRALFSKAPTLVQRTLSALRACPGYTDTLLGHSRTARPKVPS